jgi:hypothetical protein
MHADLIGGTLDNRIEATVHGYGNHMDDLTKVQIHQALEVSLLQMLNTSFLPLREVNPSIWVRDSQFEMDNN